MFSVFFRLRKFYSIIEILYFGQYIGASLVLEVLDLDIFALNNIFTLEQSKSKIHKPSDWPLTAF